MFSLNNKVALVTGARRGMGRAHAEALARQGATVVVTDINKEECEEVVAAIEDAGGSAVAYAMDVTDAKMIDAVITDVVATQGSLDILINNAGVYQPKPVAEMAEEDWDRTIAINLKGQFLCAKRAREAMAKNGWGRIINIASIASGQVGVGIAGGAHYTASKGGVIGMTETLAIEFADDGITVNAIAPGAIETPMLDDAGMGDEALAGLTAQLPLGRVGRPEEVAAAAVFLASEEASYMTGSTVYVDGGWLAA